MSLSIPNKSRTLAILSGDAITVSLRLSGLTLERSVIAERALGQGRLRLNNAAPGCWGSRHLGRKREERRETLCEADVALDADRVKRSAAIDHGRESGR